MIYYVIALFFENLVICFLSTSNFVTCYLQAIISEYAGMSSIFWACTISYVLFKITSPHYYLSYVPENDLLGFRIFALVIPLFVCIIPVIFGKFFKL